MDLDHEGGSPWDDVPSQSREPTRSASEEQPKSQPEQPEQRPAPAKPRPSPSSARGKAPRQVKRYGAQPTKLEAVDDSMGPLGPLGENFQPAPAVEPPFADTAKEPSRQPQIRSAAASTTTLRSTMSSAKLVDEEEDAFDESATRPRIPPPVMPPSGDVPQRQIQPSVSVVEAAKPSFHITVGDPHKVGDLTSAHTEYQVTTKTTSKGYKNTEFTVSRRFRDFLWLYNQLHNNNPGCIVPPHPDKQAVGRFNADFVESRRQALERMLNKIAAHPTLQNDPDLKLFLESEAFNVDIKHKERREPLMAESKGVFSSIGLGSSSVKFVEHDDWFHDRRVYLDGLENQLKQLEKAVDTVVSQRKSLAEACGEFSISLNSLSAVELSPQLSGPLEGLAELQMRVQELYDRQAQQDMLTLGIVIDEYIRTIGSCKMAFSMREKSYYSWNAAEQDLQKKKGVQEKLLRQGRSQQDRLNQISAEVSDAEKRAHQARLLFENMGKVLRNELNRFEKEKVEEFKSGVETYLESTVEAQKELIEIWETYLMRLDAEDEQGAEGQAEPSNPAGKADEQAQDLGARPESRDTDTTDGGKDQNASGDTEQPDYI